jgi:perosamine synthetase
LIPIAKPYIGEEEKEAVLAVLDSGMLAQGKITAELERRFAELCEVDYAIASSSGTTALHMALMAHGIGHGDEVITPSFTFIASVNSILYTGAQPVFVDIDPATFNIDTRLVEQAVTPKTKAIMPVHLYGQICDMEALQAIADKHGLVIIEDACQAVGATFEGNKAGSFGTGVFSLYATKNVMSAEGGMITTSDAELADRCRLLRNHGMRRRYYYESLGYNYRMTDLHAAIGLAQIERVGELTQRRRSNAAFFQSNITSAVNPEIAAGRDHVWHQYTIRVDGGRDRDQAVKQLNDAGVGTGIFYPIPGHQHDYIKAIVGEVSLPVTEQLSREVISIPVHPQLTQKDLETIVAEVNRL